MINFSELLWKHQVSGGERLFPPVAADSQDLDSAADLPQIPVEQVRIHRTNRLVLHTDPKGLGADRFRLLRMRLNEVRALANLRTLVITSPLAEDGKTTVALNLATTLAERGKRSVLLVETDLHRPSIIQRLGIQKRPGLAECLEGGLAPLSALRRIVPLNWYLLASGQAQGHPTELLQSDSLGNVMQEVSRHFDWVVIDSPPVVPLSDGLSVARHADASLLVVRAGRTPREAVQEAIALLEPKHVLGVVLNGAERLNRLHSYYGYR
jgi:capsular exopolysaccharide synthesis family protein